MQYRHRTALSFYLGTDAATILAAGAWAQGGQAIESVVVTGSHIAGVAPVGSPVVTVDQKTMDDRGFPTLSAMLSDLPQVDQIGPSPTGLTGGNNVEHAGGNQTYATSINLRGIDPADTLNLIDGMRLVAESSNSIHDVNVVPSMMVQRIDVVADGGSAIYGSDAITGTINVILKKPVGGVNLMASGSNDPGQWGYQGGISVGSTWETPVLGNGGLLVGLEYRHSDPLIEAHRPHVYFQDLSPYMGAAAPTPSTSASPGTVTLTPTGNISQCGPSPIVPAPVTAPTNCLYAIPTG